MKILINDTNYIKNLQLIENRLGAKDKIAIVLKDNAYGHGIEKISNLAKSFGVSKVVVKNINEANIVKLKFDYILVLREIPGTLQTKNIVIAINTLQDIPKIPEYSTIELKIDTSMHRNGIIENEIDEAFDLVKKKHLNIIGVFTHFASADLINSHYFVQKQIWKRIKVYIKKKYPTLSLHFHSANSSSIFRDTNYEDDFARVGIASYGYYYHNDMATKLHPVMSVTAKQVSSRNITPLEFVGYSQAGKVTKNCTISTYDIGYADGFPWKKENLNIKVAKHNLIGKVSMDYISVDSNENEIVIFDDASIFADQFDTIVYDILVKMGETK